MYATSIIIILFQIVNFLQLTEKDKQNNLEIAKNIISNVDLIDSMYARNYQVTRNFCSNYRFGHFHSKLKSDIVKDKLNGEYSFLNDSIFNRDYKNVYFLEQDIKFKNNFSNRILSFNFMNGDSGIWKLTEIAYEYFQITDVDKLYCQKIAQNIIENVDILEEIKNDSNIVTFSFRVSHGTSVKYFKNKVLNTKLNEGYSFIRDTVSKAMFQHNNFLFYKLKYKNLSKDEILWFNFQNNEYGQWKLGGISFCNNPGQQLPDAYIPCDKK